jgi:hypothetical protein
MLETSMSYKSLRAMHNILQSRFFGRRSVSQCASSYDVIEAESDELAPPLRILSTGLDRVTAGVPGHSTAAEELEAARSEFFHHGNVIRFELNDCVVHDAGIEYQGGVIPIKNSIWRRLTPKKLFEIDKLHNCMSVVSNTYFGHWLRDACATALLAGTEDPYLLHGRTDWPDTQSYAQAFGLSTNNFCAVRVRKLIQYQDYSQGFSKRKRYETLKRRLRNYFPEDHVQARFVYLRRGNTGARRIIANEDELCNKLSAIGFKIIDLDGRDLSSMFRELRSAQIVVSVDGSHVNHASFALQAGACILLLMPSDRFTMNHRGISHALGVQFGCLVIEPGPDGYAVEFSDLQRTIDLF